MGKKRKNHIPGYIGKPQIPYNPTFLGSLIIEDHEKKLKERKEQGLTRRTYKQRFPRTLKTHVRILKSVEILRYYPRYSMNNISEILGVSSRTVHRYMKRLYKMGRKAFNCMRNRLFRRSKNPSRIQRLKHIFRAFIHGEISLLEVFTLAGWDPP
jgi:DNA-directed RNA polymerase specialized sigma24 family protein